MIPDWKSNLLKLEDNLPQTEIDLRNGISSLGVTSLTNIDYCQQQAVLNTLYPNAGENDEILTSGKESEDIISPMKTASIEEIIIKIQSRQIYVAKFPLYSLEQKIFVGGVPDQIVFVNGQPRMIIELKSVKNPNNYWEEERYQLLIYRYLLDKMGFDVSNVINLLIKTRRSANVEELTEKRIRHIQKRLLEGENIALDVIRKFDISSNDIRMYVLDYQLHDVKQKLNEYLEFYMELETQPEKTDNPNKCKSCIFNPGSNRFNPSHIICPYFDTN